VHGGHAPAMIGKSLRAGHSGNILIRNHALTR
jgi:hypothetical protein